jgi:phosphoenolpyruvate synthase/pyruvate phosphate dikinase
VSEEPQLPATVLTLADCVDLPVERIGGKALGLGRLLSLSADVPPGFVVDTGVFSAWMDAHGLAARVRDRLHGATDVAALKAATSDIAALISAVPLESADIDDAYSRLPGEQEPAVAVRSSATGEDTQASSYAGQQETFLWVRGAAEVRRRIVDCWASLFSFEAVEYRLHLGVDPEQGEMAVVVQAMVDAEAAGVMFTIDPLTGDPSQITIESTVGLGVPLVSGEVTPDRYCIDKVTLELRSRTIAQKPFADRLDHELGTTSRTKLSEEVGGASSLSDAEVVALAEIGKRLERASGSALDIEWALGPGAGDGGRERSRQIFLLQARPETGERARSQASADRRSAIDHMVRGLRRSGSTSRRTV